MSTSSEEKMSDKVFLQSILTSILSILLCIFSLCSVTYAWFNEGVSSVQNNIQSGFFALDIDIIDADGKSLVGIKNEDGSVTYFLEEALKKYTVTLKTTKDTKVSKGFCVITTSPEMKKNTAPISDNNEIGCNPFTFTLISNESNISVTFSASWGMPAVEDVKKDGILTIGNPENSGE